MAGTEGAVPPAGGASPGLFCRVWLLQCPYSECKAASPRRSKDANERPLPGPGLVQKGCLGCTVSAKQILILTSLPDRLMRLFMICLYNMMTFSF